jgi:IS30 family transposase
MSGRRGPAEALYQHLRRGGKKYRSKKSRQAGVHCIPNRVGIEERPAEVVERKSKFLRMKKIGRKTMENTTTSSNNLLKKHKKFVSSITFDIDRVAIFFGICGG